MEKLKSYLTFKIGKEYFAANAIFIHNIIEIPQITEMPEMPIYMMGVINLRGLVLPVIDSRVKFGTEKTEITSDSCIIVMEITVKDEPVFIGMLVDAVDEVIEIEDKDIKETPSMGTENSSAYIIGAYTYKERFALILNMNHVLGSNELIILDKLNKTEIEPRE